jgi:4-carboxymuconolactone decarboxylase
VKKLRRGILNARISRAQLCLLRKEFAVDKETFERGLAIRRQVLGADFVDNAFQTADDFNRPLQELVTQYCWGEIWGRPGLDRKTRSMLNLAMLSALNRPHEIKAHVRGALANGLTKDEIREVFLQVAVYCGVPAAVDSFRLAREVFKELGDV